MRRPTVDCGDVLWIFLTKNKVAIIDACDADLAAHTWTAKTNRLKTYAYRQGSGWRLRMHREVARRIGIPDSLIADHINGDTLDNRRSNLRAATVAQNNQNIGANRRNTSGVKGVIWNKKDQKWRAHISVRNTRYFLGNFTVLEEAAAAYRAAALRLHGEFARFEWANSAKLAPASKTP